MGKLEEQIQEEFEKNSALIRMCFSITNIAKL